MAAVTEVFYCPVAGACSCCLGEGGRRRFFSQKHIGIWVDAREGLDAYCTTIIDLTMVVPNSLCALVHCVRLVQEIRSCRSRCEVGDMSLNNGVFWWRGRRKVQMDLLLALWENLCGDQYEQWIAEKKKLILGKSESCKSLLRVAAEHKHKKTEHKTERKRKRSSLPRCRGYLTIDLLLLGYTREKGGKKNAHHTMAHRTSLHIQKAKQH
jgi:hypothetical protein